MVKLSRLILIVLCTATCFIAAAQSLESDVDKLLLAQYKPGGPGATALIAKNGKVIYRKAFGKANLELNVPMKPENVFELGSITKQFTAVAILMLQEQGKLSLQDDITKYISDYPVHGKKITVHQLLNHTSGIKSYTSIPSFMKMARTDMSPTELINSFKNEPMDFDPGEKWSYNNSGYIILGYIIEKVSGKTYADFIEENIFKKVGMSHSLYGSMSKIIPGRANGYQPAKNGYVNADYLSLSLPYAAGSLMSTVDDMFLWSQAIHTNKLITNESKQKAFANTTLNDGKPTYYGYGWMPNDINGSSSIEHGGGIFGYTTMGIYVPSDNVYVIILTNSNDNSPDEVATKITALALGKPYATKAITLTPAQMQKWVGTYEFEEGVLRMITLDGNEIYSQKAGSIKIKLLPTGANTFTFEGSTTQYEFKEVAGKKSVVYKNRIQQSAGIETSKKTTVEKATAEKASVVLDANQLKEYIGSYELQPGFVIDVTSIGNQLFAQATNQPRFELFAVKPGSFFLKVVEASIDFNKDTTGKIISLTLHQGGRDIEGQKIK